MFHWTLSDPVPFARVLTKPKGERISSPSAVALCLFKCANSSWCTLTPTETDRLSLHSTLWTRMMLHVLDRLGGHKIGQLPAVTPVPWIGLDCLNMGKVLVSLVCACSVCGQALFSLHFSSSPARPDPLPLSFLDPSWSLGHDGTVEPFDGFLLEHRSWDSLAV